MKYNNKDYLLCLLCDNEIEPDCLSEVSSHYRFNEWDFWLTKKQKFWNRETGEKGSGIEFLIKRINYTKV